MLKAALKRDGVGERHVSRWLCRQIADLLEKDPALISVGRGEAVTTFPLRRNITIDTETDAVLDQGLRVLLVQDPRFPGAASAIVRAAIKHGFRRGELGAS